MIHHPSDGPAPPAEYGTSGEWDEAPGFDLVSEPWIPLAGADGASHRTGLLEALARAHEFADIQHPVPLVEAGVWRLLVAVALDVFQPRSIKDLLDLLEVGRFDEGRLGHYLKAHRQAFDLFSASRPFLQDATAGGHEKSTAALLPSRPSGTNVVHWSRGREDDFAVTPAEAALLLTTVAPFMTAGGAGLPPSINGAPPYYTMIEGETLFRSIVLNMWVDHRGIDWGVPAWRRTTRLVTNGRRSSATLLESYTWQPRRIRLLPDGGGESSLSGETSPVLVRRMHFAAGESCDFTWTDPNVGYQVTADKRSPLRPREDREPWRDIGGLALLSEHLDAEAAPRGARARAVRIRPAIVSQFARLSEDAPMLVGRSLRLRLYGMRTDLKMKVFEWHRQTIELPLPIILREPLSGRVVQAVDQARKIQEELDRALRRAVTRSTHTPGAELDAMMRAARRRYWTRAEPAFRRLVERLGSVRDIERDVESIAEATREWRDRLAQLAHDAFAAATASLRFDAVSLMATERARGWLERSLKHLRQDDRSHAT